MISIHLKYALLFYLSLGFVAALVVIYAVVTLMPQIIDGAVPCLFCPMVMIMSFYSSYKLYNKFYVLSSVLNSYFF